MLRRCTARLSTRASESYLHDGELAFDHHKKIMRSKEGMPRTGVGYTPPTWAMAHPASFREMKNVSDNTPIEGELHAEGAYPNIAVIALAFFFFCFYLFLGMYDGKRIYYLTPDPDRTSKYIKFAPHPVRYGNEPLVNEENRGGMCIIRPGPDLTKIKSHPFTANMGH